MGRQPVGQVHSLLAQPRASPGPVYVSVGSPSNRARRRRPVCRLLAPVPSRPPWPACGLPPRRPRRAGHGAGVQRGADGSAVHAKAAPTTATRGSSALHARAALRAGRARTRTRAPAARRSTRATGPLAGEVKASSRWPLALRTSRAACASPAMTTSTPRFAHAGSLATSSASARLSGPSAAGRVAGRIAPVTAPATAAAARCAPLPHVGQLVQVGMRSRRMSQDDLADARDNGNDVVTRKQSRLWASNGSSPESLQARRCTSAWRSTSSTCRSCPGCASAELDGFGYEELKQTMFAIARHAGVGRIRHRRDQPSDRRRLQQHLAPGRTPGPGVHGPSRRGRAIPGTQRPISQPPDLGRRLIGARVPQPIATDRASASIT